MDFVVVGFGLGALGVLLGVVLLGWLAPRAQRAAVRAPAADDAARALAVAAERRDTGQALLYAGAGMLLATVGGLAGSLDDRTGALLVTTTATVAAIGILLRGFLQRARNPVPPRRRARPAPPAAASHVAGAPPATVPFAADAPAPVMREGAAGEPYADPLPAPESTEVAATEGTAPPRAAADGEPAFEAADPGPGNAPLFSGQSPNPERRRRAGFPAAPESDDTVLAEEEGAAVVEFVVHAARRAGSPPSRPDEEGEDPS